MSLPTTPSVQERADVVKRQLKYQRQLNNVAKRGFAYLPDAIGYCLERELIDEAFRKDGGRSTLRTTADTSTTTTTTTMLLTLLASITNTILKQRERGWDTCLRPSLTNTIRSQRERGWDTCLRSILTEAKGFSCVKRSCRSLCFGSRALPCAPCVEQTGHLIHTHLHRIGQACLACARLRCNFWCIANTWLKNNPQSK
jgi:hypothetical protein